APAVQHLFEIRDPMPGLATGLSWMAPGLIGLSLIFHGARVLYSAGHQRGAVIATASGWLSLVATAWLAVSVLHPGPDAPWYIYQTTALTGIGIGHALGMSIAAVGLLRCIMGLITHRWLLRRSLTTYLGAIIAAGAAGVLGRLVVDALLGSVGGIGGILLAGFVGAFLAVGIVAGVSVGVDRSILKALSRHHAIPTSNS
ncbi:MAG TPA: hypothetical protein VK054_00705, partial [Beutenbergiaceae bacterium]|nr:hypothetical protein [Beutenbergiaceae bacterium]